jgi:hypothetical protein
VEHLYNNYANIDDEDDDYIDNDQDANEELVKRAYPPTNTKKLSKNNQNELSSIEYNNILEDA